MKYEQQIDRFLFGQMSSEEESLFLQECKTNSELREEAQMTALLVKALRHCVHIEDYMNSIHDKNHPMYKDNLNKIKHGYTNGKPNWDVNEHNLEN